MTPIECLNKAVEAMSLVLDEALLAMSPPKLTREDIFTRAILDDPFVKMEIHYRDRRCTIYVTLSQVEDCADLVGYLRRTSSLIDMLEMLTIGQNPT